MKILLTSVLILSASASAFADHTAFVPQTSDQPAVTEVVKSPRKASLYPPYTRNAAHVPPAKSAAAKDDASNRPASRYPAYSRNNPHSQPASSPAVSVAGTTSQKKSEVSDK